MIFKNKPLKNIANGCSTIFLHRTKWNNFQENMVMLWANVVCKYVVQICTLVSRWLWYTPINSLSLYMGIVWMVASLWWTFDISLIAISCYIIITYKYRACILTISITIWNKINIWLSLTQVKCNESNYWYNISDINVISIVCYTKFYYITCYLYWKCWDALNNNIVCFLLRGNRNKFSFLNKIFSCIFLSSHLMNTLTGRTIVSSCVTNFCVKLNPPL